MPETHDQPSGLARLVAGILLIAALGTALLWLSGPLAETGGVS